jgi:PAS domain
VSESPQRVGIWEDPSFLEHCRPAIARLYAYWDGKRHGRKMPARADIDPVEMREWLGRIILYDVLRDPLNFRYRLIGSQIVYAAGADLTGCLISDQTVSSNKDATMKNLSEIVARRSFRFRNEPIQGRDNLFRSDQRIFLPLSRTDEVEMILFYYESVDLMHGGADDPRASSRIFGTIASGPKE